MKRLFGDLLAIMALLALVTGCSTPSAESGNVSTNKDSISTYNAVPQEQPLQSEPTLITREEAKNIALSAVGVTEDDVTRLTIELDYDDDALRWEYEVDFLWENREAELEVDALTGAVLRKEIENEKNIVTQKPVSTTTTTASSAYRIGYDQAKELALNKAGVSAEQITGYEIELDYDDDTGRWEYEISFHVGRTEYELEMDADTGTIIRYEKDIDD